MSKDTLTINAREFEIEHNGVTYDAAIDWLPQVGILKAVYRKQGQTGDYIMLASRGFSRTTLSKKENINKAYNQFISRLNDKIAEEFKIVDNEPEKGEARLKWLIANTTEKDNVFKLGE